MKKLVLLGLFIFCIKNLLASSEFSQKARTKAIFLLCWKDGATNHFEKEETSAYKGRSVYEKVTLKHSDGVKRTTMRALLGFRGPDGREYKVPYQDYPKTLKSDESVVISSEFFPDAEMFCMERKTTCSILGSILTKTYVEEFVGSAIAPSYRNNLL